MPPNLKRIFLAIALLLVAALIGLGLFLMFKKTTPQIKYPPQQEKETQGGKLPEAGERQTGVPSATEQTTAGTLPTAGYIPQVTPSYYKPTPVTKIVSDYALFTSVSQNGALRYHNGSDGKFYRASADGTIKEMVDQVFYNVQDVTWAKNKDEAVLEYPDGSKIIYNFETRKQVTIPKHWEEFSFSQDGSEIAAKSIGLSPENRWLITFNDDGTGAKMIESMGDNADKVQVNWSPSRQVVAFSQTGEPLGADRVEVLLVGLNGENFPSTVVEGRGFDPLWSPTGSRLLYSVYSTRSNYKPELWVVDSYGDHIGDNRQMLKINTWADKCSFQDNSTLYCAVPRDMPDGAGMIPDLTAGAYDDLYKIDLKTGLKTGVNLGGDYQITNLSFDKTNNKLFFTNKNQPGIFEVKI